MGSTPTPAISLGVDLPELPGLLPGALPELFSKLLPELPGLLPERPGLLLNSFELLLHESPGVAPRVARV